MKTFVTTLLLFSVAHAQYPWLNSFPCNSCYGPSYCFNDNDNLPGECTGCLQTHCENQLDLLSVASQGLACIHRVWNDPVYCQKQCPPWTSYHNWRLSRCSSCLTPCIATVFNTEAGQCEIEEVSDSGNDLCAAETNQPCGTCYRSNRCFTENELISFGGICKDYLKLKCPNPTDIACLKEAYSDSCSTCPAVTTSTEARFQSCELCIDQCTAKQQCLDGCRNNLPKNPTKVPCPLCRAFCKINSFDRNCERKCDCNQCDSCYNTCDNLAGGDFNLFNPCRCLNKEEDAPIKKVQRSRILGGSKSCEGDWPWAVHIYYKGLEPRNGAVCGGTLFNNNWIITAAHCFQTENPSIYSVVLGDHILSDKSEREVHRDIARIETHPLFDGLSYNYDVAVAQLSEPVTYTKYIQPLAIAPPGTRTDNNEAPSFAGRLCKTVGWGLTSSTTRRDSNVLRELGVRITPTLLCEIQTLKGYTQGPVLSPRLGVPPTKFCAGGVGGEDSCNGDSGGSLFCLHDDGKYVLHGITSYGTLECGKPLHPGVYTKVAEVSSWISTCISVNRCRPLEDQTSR